MAFKDIEHLFRLGAIFAAGALLFVGVRAEMVPKDFGRDGHYRPQAVDAIRSRPPVHAGQKACAECHVDVVEKRAKARHAAISCEACHGPLAKHASGADESKPALPEGRTLCIRCHAAGTGKPARQPSVPIAKDHAGDEKCVTCHKPHDPRIARGHGHHGQHTPLVHLRRQQAAAS